MVRPGSPTGMAALQRPVAHTTSPSAVLLQLHILTVQRDRLAKEKSVLEGRVAYIEQQLARLGIEMKRFERYLLRLGGLGDEETAEQPPGQSRWARAADQRSRVFLLEY